MAQSNVVFLIDVNGVPRDPAIIEAKVKFEQIEEEGRKASDIQNESVDLFSSQKEEEGEEVPSSSLPSATTSSEMLTWLKEFVLVTLFKEANTGKEYDFSRVQWSFKFFDSSHLVDYRDCRSFLPFDNESFTTFESQLSQRMKPKTASSNSNLGIDEYSNYDNSNIKFLSDAIKIITGSLPWPEAPQLNSSKSFNLEDEIITKNTVFAFLRVPRNEKQLLDFSDLRGSSSSKDFMNVLLPSAFSHKFHHKLRIQLNFVDMWSAPENSKHCYIPDWSGSYPRQIVKCVSYLGGGKVVSVPLPGITSLSSSSKSLGLLPYITYLRSCLQHNSAQNENVPSHIQRLAPAKAFLKNNQKISPDFDSDSVSRSLKSGSVLEASYNSKVVRPYHGHRLSLGGAGGGFDDEDRNFEFVRHHKHAQERMLREENRKRKRYDYDEPAEDYYSSGAMRRYNSAMLDDMESDSVEIDSQCEREQRLENWVNDGVFTAKRKREAPPTKTIPMSRPGLSKSFHVFHEPAPKLPGFRGKKMLATVERHKFKTEMVETKRRNSGGGAFEMPDIKRITDKQEKELSAIKRRLKAYLQGELEDEDGDPVAWFKKFQKLLRSFADMILTEPDPCLVALAQALVNCASVKFSPQRVAELRELYRSRSVTAKELLEQLLLMEQTALNMRIISAQQKPTRDKLSPSSSTHHKQKMVTFRETELQIILRLEIAWCFFIEPDEEAMEDLLQEVASLLQLIAAYRTTPPIEHFVNTILFPTYNQSSRFMRALYKKMNLPLPSTPAMDGSPVPSSSRRDDDSSMISSTSSTNLCPEDSASQLDSHHSSKHHHHHHQHHRRLSPLIKKRTSLPIHRPARKVLTTAGSKKIRQRQFMVASSNPKLAVSQSFIMEKTDPQKKGVGVTTKVSPKRVRRNLFDVQKKDKKDSKLLLTLASSSSRIKSPAFKSPKSGKSTLSPSGFFRAARSRRQLVMSANSQTSGERQFGSPSGNNDILCPESPATPGGALSISSKYGPTSISGSTERIVQESPEIQKNIPEFDNRPMGRVASLSFYSTRAPKSRAWERSETQLMAARIKESVDIRCKELSLSDFEHIPSSPDEKCTENPSRISESNASDTPKTNFSFCADSYAERNPEASPLHESSTRSQLIPHLTGPAPDLNNPNIEALITSNSTLFPLFSKTVDTDVVLPVVQTDPYAGRSPSVVHEAARVTASGNSPISNLQTPSKRVQFNLAENLVNTPSRRASTGTPKSILKETHDTTL